MGFSYMLSSWLSSLLFLVPLHCLQADGRPGQWAVTDVDYCMYGAEYRKRTRLLSLQWQSFPNFEGENFLSHLAKKCDGSHEHVMLSGWGKPGQKSRPTKGTAKYPLKLAQTWAKVAGAHIIRTL